MAKKISNRKIAVLAMVITGVIGLCTPELRTLLGFGVEASALAKGHITNPKKQISPNGSEQPVLVGANINVEYKASNISKKQNIGLIVVDKYRNFWGYGTSNTGFFPGVQIGDQKSLNDKFYLMLVVGDDLPTGLLQQNQVDQFVILDKVQVIRGY